MGQFRRNDVDDPEVFVTALTAIMALYPPCVLDYLCSPVTGLANLGTFVPSLHEIRTACNEQMKFEIARWKLSQLPPERRNRFAPGYKKPEALAPPTDADTARRKEFIGGLKAKHGDHFGLGAPEQKPEPSETYKPKTLGELSEHYRTHGLAFVKKPHSQIKPEKHDDQDRFEYDAVPQGADGDQQD